jgi:hypothetical protein
MSEPQVDRVLEMQDSQGGYFGEQAVKAGYITPPQLRQLLDIQTLHDQLFLAEQLVIADILDVPTLVSNLSEFLGGATPSCAT